MVYNIVPVIPFEVLTEMWKKSSTKKQYILEALARDEYKMVSKYKHRTHFVGAKSKK